jgi:hypothetical protein
MTDEDLWFEPVSLLARCSLNEGLLWVWAKRVPISNIYREKNAFETLADWECERLAIPPVPEGIRRGAQFLTEERLRRREQELGSRPRDIRELRVAKGMEEAAAAREWLPFVIAAIELPATKIFLKLREGQIQAAGKRLPEGAAIIDFLEQDNSYGGSDFDHLVDTAIPADLWTMPGIEWISNALTAKSICYCDVSLSVETLMAEFPPAPTPVEGAEFVGDLLRVKEPVAENVRLSTARSLGRPPMFAWEAFHVEVASRLKNGQLPQKKEAAIQEMLSWFESTQKTKRPSRSAVSEKLTPYYRRFFSN